MLSPADKRILVHFEVKIKHFRASIYCIFNGQICEILSFSITMPINWLAISLILLITTVLLSVTLQRTRLRAWVLSYVYAYCIRAYRICHHCHVGL